MARDHRPAARSTPPATVALVAAAALAPTEPPPPEETDRVEGPPSTVEELTAELTAVKIRAAALEGERDELLLRVARLEADLVEARNEFDAQRERFNAAWAKRDLSPERVIADPPRKPLADAQLVVLVHGKRTVLLPGDEIPESIDPKTLPPGSVR